MALDDRDVDITGRPLTKREQEVLEHIVDGRTNPEIAILVGIDRETVKFHTIRLFRKLDVESRVSAAVKAVRTGLV